jgi:hypothetical protein
MAEDMNKRMNYFDRQFLRAADFKVEQDYHLERHRRHNRLLHTAGFAGPTDLEIGGKLGQASVTVKSGTAIDTQGREIVVPDPQELPLTDEQISEAGKYAIYVELKENPTDPSTDPGTEGGFMRTTETPYFRFQKVADAPDYPPLTLAAITVDGDKNLTEIDHSMRKLAGTVAGLAGKFADITASSLTLEQEEQETVQITSDGVIDSPMWRVVQSKKAAIGQNVDPNGRIKVIDVKTKGGDLLIFASGSVSSNTAVTSEEGISVGIDIFRDNDPNALGGAPSVPGCAKPNQTNVAVAATLFVPGGKTSTTLELKAADNTKLSTNDFYSITVLELPFNKPIG